MMTITNTPIQIEGISTVIPLTCLYRPGRHGIENGTSALSNNVKQTPFNREPFVVISMRDLAVKAVEHSS